jgi:hypothetical protein
MIKKAIFLCLLSILMTVPVVFGQKSNIHFQVGVRYQLASWNYKDATYYKSEDDLLNGVDTEFESEMGNIYGPTISVSYQKFGFSATYMMGAWEYPNQWVKIYHWYSSYNQWIWDDDDEMEYSIKRYDLVMTASYQVMPRLSVFLGFKNLIIKDKSSHGYYTSLDDEDTFTGSGVGGGLSGSYPFSPMFHGYATFGYLSLGGDYEGWGNLILEGGIRLYFKNTPIFAALGYRYESFTGSDTMHDAVLPGPVLTVAFYK